MTGDSASEMAQASLLRSYLKQLKLPTIGRSYAQVAREARQEHSSYEAFLLSLLEQEVA